MIITRLKKSVLITTAAIFFGVNVMAGLFEYCLHTPNGPSGSGDTCAKAGSGGGCTGDCYQYVATGVGYCMSGGWWCSQGYGGSYAYYEGECVPEDCGCVLDQEPARYVTGGSC